MQYVLTVWLSGKHPKLELTKIEYNRIRDAQAGVRCLLQIEELFNLIIGNYIDFEKILLNLTLEYSVYQDINY